MLRLLKESSRTSTSVLEASRSTFIFCAQIKKKHEEALQCSQLAAGGDLAPMNRLIVTTTSHGFWMKWSTAGRDSCRTAEHVYARGQCPPKIPSGHGPPGIPDFRVHRGSGEGEASTPVHASVHWSPTTATSCLI